MSDSEVSAEQGFTSLFSLSNRNYEDKDDPRIWKNEGDRYTRMIQNAPVLDKKGHQLWNRRFLSYLQTHDLHRIALDEEQYPQRVSQSSNPIKSIADRRAIYRQRKEAVLMILRHAILNGLTAEDPTYPLFLNIADMTNIKHMWTELNSFLDVKGSAEVLVSILEWIQCNLLNDKTKNLDTYKSENSTKYRRVKDAKVSLDQLNAVLFLKGLPPRYNQVIQTFMQRESFTVDEVYRQAKLYDVSQESLQSNGFATYESARNATEISEEEDANYARTKRKFVKGNGKMLRFNGKLYTHNPKQKPNSPTSWERNFTCELCNTKGHKKRTCHKSKSDKKEKDHDQAKGNGEQQNKRKNNRQRLRKKKNKQDVRRRQPR
jgi:hypothetical protein